MEGAYNKVLASKNNLPAAEYYTYFIDQLATTVRWAPRDGTAEMRHTLRFREEIASCCEKAYRALKVSDAKKLMMLDSTQDMLNYAQQV